MELINFDILSFLTQTQQIDYEAYAAVIKNLLPANYLCGKEMLLLAEQPYKHIVDIEKRYRALSQRPQNKIDIAAICFQVDTEDIERVGIFDFYRAFNFITQQFNTLIERENKVLSYEPDAEEFEAGIQSLGKFGRLATIDSLSGGDLLKHKEIIELPYSRVFTKLYLESEKAKYQKKLQTIRANKQVA